MKRLDGKIAIITGASAGIGKASATLFAKEGATLGLIDINDADGEAVAKQIEAEGGKAERSDAVIQEVKRLKLKV